jgi:hypothetical protein
MENRYIILVANSYDLEISDDGTIYVDYYDCKSDLKTYGYYGNNTTIDTNVGTSNIDECEVYIYKNSIKTDCINSYVMKGKICFCN